MKIRDIMTASPTYLMEDATVREAAAKMKELDCGFIPVGNGDKLTGIVTDRDIALRCCAEGASCDTKLSDIMTSEVLYCFETDSPDAVAKNMAENEVRRLIVLNDQSSKRLVGVVSLCDIVNASKISANTSAQLIQGVSNPNTSGKKSKAA